MDYRGLEWQRRSMPQVDLETAVAKLREHESSVKVDAIGAVPVTRFDSLRLEVTDPCEDNYTFETHDLGNGRLWQFWGVFDGHA